MPVRALRTYIGRQRILELKDTGDKELKHTQSTQRQV